ncbi:hypothetical protein BBK82_38355 [Lentzea guizhouensis]|uniref:Uncharacterized protein n=1 Tax=Lentzea guizhouensis TaxID=1586287 RepID=A0A1B2HTC2_9PSEU|nr:hypothetical protein BBK82_38355 [Lentzea guizhouensis]
MPPSHSHAIASAAAAWIAVGIERPITCETAGTPASRATFASRPNGSANAIPSTTAIPTVSSASARIIRTTCRRPVPTRRSNANSRRR